MSLFSVEIERNDKYLMSGAKGNSEFCFPETLSAPRGKAKGNIEVKWKQSSLFPAIGHVRYINIQASLRGFRVKIANFSSLLCPSIPKRDLDTKKTTPNIEV